MASKLNEDVCVCVICRSNLVSEKGGNDISTVGRRINT